MLICRTPGVLQSPILFGGEQQGSLRPGTEPVALIVAMTDAFEDANDASKLVKRVPLLQSMTDAIRATLLPFVASGQVLFTGCTEPHERLPHHVSFCVYGADRKELVATMEKAGILVSSGSACSSKSAMPSHVLVAMHVSDAYIRGSLRISLSHLNTMEEVTGRICPALVQLLQRRSVR